MLPLMIDAAIRSLALGATAGLGLLVFRVRNIRLERAVWTTVLGAALLMPVLMEWPVLRMPALQVNRAAVLPALQMQVSPAESRPDGTQTARRPAQPGNAAIPMGCCCDLRLSDGRGNILRAALVRRVSGMANPAKSHAAAGKLDQRRRCAGQLNCQDAGYHRRHDSSAGRFQDVGF